jgi:uncharacterized repeat protein (TIGR03803 family)
MARFSPSTVMAQVLRIFMFLLASATGNPYAGLTLSANTHTLYGTTSRGGNSDLGTVFSLSFAPQLTITLPETTSFYRGRPTSPDSITGYFAIDEPGFQVWTTVAPGRSSQTGSKLVNNAIPADRSSTG